MSNVREQRTSRLAIWFVIIGLSLAATGLSYISWAGRERQIPAVSNEAALRTAKSLQIGVATLIISLVLFLVFMLGAYLINRVARLIPTAEPSTTRTEYVDVWSEYRVTDQQIDDATEEEDDRPVDDA